MIIPNNQNRPAISIIVIFHNMRREAQRTLFSLSSAYQQGIAEGAWEVIAIDNASSSPLKNEEVRSFGNNFHYYYFDTDSPSPVGAINFGVSVASAEAVAICIDGARIVSPGMLRYTVDCFGLFENPFVCSLGWHLGQQLQNYSMLEGYDQAVEDKMLHETQWREDGYQLFSISCLAASAANGFFSRLHESNFCSLNKSTFLRIGGYDPQFNEPGGGLVNLDFYNRVSQLKDVQTIHLLGEGTFHQFHGGVATNVPMQEHRYEQYLANFERIRGKPYAPSSVTAKYYGHMPKAAHRFLRSNKSSGGTGQE